MTEQPLWQQYRQQIEAYRDAQLNFDLQRVHEYTKENGWNVDDYEAELPPESPGQPQAHGSWQAACTVLREYRFPPPDLITGIFIPDQPLEQRIMLLRGTFLGFSFYFGVKIGGVIDETRETEHGPERVWGYNYQTLQGHFERGQIEFTIVKLLETGQVLFRIHAFSQTGRIRNPFYWLGFKLFGRHLQLRFARDAMQRMQTLVQEALAGVPSQTSQPTPIQSTANNPEAAEQLAEVVENQAP